MKHDSLLMNVWELVIGYIFLTIVWLIFCLPLVTIGAATSAFYGTARRYLMAREGYLLKTFWKSFSSSFRQATILWLVSAAAGFLIFQGIRIMQVLSAGVWSGAFQGVQILSASLIAAMLLYALPGIARFKNSLLQIIKNSLLLLIRHFGRTLLILLLIVAGSLVIYLIPVFLIIIPSLLMLFWCYWLEKIFALYLPEDPNEAPGEAI